MPKKHEALAREIVDEARGIWVKLRNLSILVTRLDEAGYDYGDVIESLAYCEEVVGEQVPEAVAADFDIED